MGGRGFYLAITGGIGGAKLALGLSRILSPEALVLVVNTGDDFEHLGLHISPEIDTATDTLAGKNNLITGWGRRDETWTFMEALAELGGETWFSLGDGDLAIHVERTRRLLAGDSLGQITEDFSQALGISAHLLPMSDDPLRTMIETPEGAISFQDYFVRKQSKPVIENIVFTGVDKAVPNATAMAALRLPNLCAVIICPSNPFLSINPILSVPGIREAMQASPAPVVGISPIIGGQAVKGPTVKIMAELSLPLTVQTIVEHYDGLLDGYIIDNTDSDVSNEMCIPVMVTETLMKSIEDRENLARNVLAFADTLTVRHTFLIALVSPRCALMSHEHDVALPSLFRCRGAGQVLYEC